MGVLKSVLHIILIAISIYYYMENKARLGEEIGNDLEKIARAVTVTMNGAFLGSITHAHLTVLFVRNTNQFF